jgi:AcrR family transcriptional regulator
VRDGYSATSISAIAEKAGVAVPTVYASLKRKANIVRAVVELTVRGDDEWAPLASRAGWQEVERERDPRKQLALFAHFHRPICDRKAPIFAQLQAAAGPDPEATKWLAEEARLRYEMHSQVLGASRGVSSCARAHGPRDRRRHAESRRSNSPGGRFSGRSQPRAGLHARRHCAYRTSLAGCSRSAVARLSRACSPRADAEVTL